MGWALLAALLFLSSGCCAREQLSGAPSPPVPRFWSPVWGHYSPSSGQTLDDQLLGLCGSGLISMSSAHISENSAHLECSRCQSVSAFASFSIYLVDLPICSPLLKPFQAETIFQRCKEMWRFGFCGGSSLICCCERPAAPSAPLQLAAGQQARLLDPRLFSSGRDSKVGRRRGWGLTWNRPREKWQDRWDKVAASLRITACWHTPTD